MITLKNLIQGYKKNQIEAEIYKDIIEDKERAGIIKFSEDINGSYLLDEEGIIIAINIFSNCVVEKNKTMNRQIEHITQILLIIQKTIELIGNVKQEEANSIMKSLGMFSHKIKEKSVRFLNYIYKISAENGIIMFSIQEEAEE